MLYLMLLISIISLVLNFKMYQRITATPVVSSVEDFDFTPVINYCCKAEDVPIEPEVPSQVTMVQADHLPWKNQTNIPWNGPMKPPEPAIIPIERGPLERPPGFV